MLSNPVPFLIALAVMFVLWFLFALVTKNWGPVKVFEGQDGQPSSSKLQFWLWTLVALFSYVAIYAARLLDAHSTEAIKEIPHNLLIAMGMSIATATGAKSITSSYVQSGKVTKPQAAASNTAANQGAGGNAQQPQQPQQAGQANAKPGAKASSISMLFTDDDGTPDLSKIQMLAWTVISIGIYLISVGYEVGSKDPAKLAQGLPDIDTALMVLMGLGQGAYLGKKLVTTTTPRITGLSPGTGAAGTRITMSGLSFGDSMNGGQVTYDGRPIDSSLVSNWQDTSIQFAIPATNPDGNPWPAGQTQHIQIGVICSGQVAANQLPFAVTTPAA
jgi:hypothetical protein